MSDGVDDSVNSWSSGNTLPEVIAGLYYRYGLIVATHPLKFISWSILLFLLMSTPLWYLPFPGYLPQNYVTCIKNYSVPPPASEGGIQLSLSPTPAPLWYQGPPRAYIQQIVIKSLVAPWENGLTVADSIRGPLSTVFPLTRLISDFQKKSNRSITLGSECLLVDDVVKKFKKHVPTLPHFNCLILSPADIWGRDFEAFKEDQDVLRTIKSLKTNYDEASIADILFGVPSKDIGLFSDDGQPKAVSFAITIALTHYSEEFMNDLEDELKLKYSLHQPIEFSREMMVHIYFPSRISILEFLILIFYGVLFSSICFSVKKINGLYSNFGLSVSIMATLVASLFLATSFSAHFGLRPLHSKGKFFYPVLTALMGFENSMALLRSVLTTPDYLDVKIRVAQGLAKEGWAITKYFLSMITVVTISFFLFIPLVQEMCIYSSLVLMCDFYLQLVFFTAVIAIDLKRIEGNERWKCTNYVNPLFKYPSVSSDKQLINQNCVNESPSVPNLHHRRTRSNRGEDRLAQPQSKAHPAKDMPRRLKFTYFVARKRMFQRMLMCSFIGWSFWMIYTSEMVTHMTHSDNFTSRNKDLASLIFSLRKNISVTNKNDSLKVDNEKVYLDSSYSKNAKSLTDKDKRTLNENILHQLKHQRWSFDKWLPMSHWPALFSYYNISLRGHYLTILPPIMLSIAVPSEEAKKFSLPLDSNSQEWLPQFQDTNDVDVDDENWFNESAIIPSSRGELLLAAIMVITALAVLIYATIALYRCICSRNYAEWRSSRWFFEKSVDGTSEVIGDAIPLVLSRHVHDVECLSTDGSIVVSSCLAGFIIAWDPMNGECISSINRNKTIKRSQSTEAKNVPSSPECRCDGFCDSGMNFNSYDKKCRCSSKSINNSYQSMQSNMSCSLSDLQPSDTSFSPSPSRYYSSIHRFEPNRKNFDFGSSQKMYDEIPPLSKRNLSFNTFQIAEQDKEMSLSHRNETHKHLRNLSAGSLSCADFKDLGHTVNYQRDGSHERNSFSDRCPIWCLEFAGGFLYVGTGSGAVEVWDIFSPVLKVIYDDQSGVGVTFLKLQGKLLVTVRLSGCVDILSVQTSSSNRSGDSPNSGTWIHGPEEDVRLIRKCSVKAHQQPITVLSCSYNRIVTGSYDHTLKVLNLSDGNVLFTLHGHCGPITSVTLGGPLSNGDLVSVGITVEFGGVGDVIASGAQDGSLCVWEFQSGACVYSVQAHDGAINSLTCTSSYILSLGSDDRLCVWERIQGHLLNTLIMTQMYCDSMLMLTNKLLITGQQGSLTVWDITVGAPVRVVRLGDRDRTIFVRHLLPVSGSVVCDYGNELRAVRLLVAEKYD